MMVATLWNKCRYSCSNQWPTLYGSEVVKENDTLTTDLLDSFSNNDDYVTETNYIPASRISKIRSELDWCETKIGVQSYVNKKGQRYLWPTMLCFMRKK